MQTIATYNHKGGTGKSTIAVNLARACMLSGKKTAILDRDRQGTIAMLAADPDFPVPTYTNDDALPGDLDILVIDYRNGEVKSLAADEPAVILVPTKPSGGDWQATQIAMRELAALPYRPKIRLILNDFNAAYQTHVGMLDIMSDAYPDLLIVPARTAFETATTLYTTVYDLPQSSGSRTARASIDLVAQVITGE